MKIKTALLIVLLMLFATACAKQEAAETKSGVAQEQIQQAAEPNQTIPPGTVVQQIKSQIRFSMQNPENTENIETK